MEKMSIAVLVDGENVSPSYLATIQEKTTPFRADVRRVYGDWGRSDLGPWRPAAEASGYRLIQVTRLMQGKSAVDQMMAVDAMGFVKEGRVKAVALVTNDTDFVPLLQRLREEGVFTVLIGDHRAPLALRAAAHEFHALPVIVATGERDAGQAVTMALAELAPHVRAAFDETQKHGLANMGALGIALRKRLPKFDPKEFGAKRLMDVIAKLDGFSILTEDHGEHAPTHLVRLKG